MRRNRKPDIHHYGQADDPRRCLEVQEEIVIFHSKFLRNFYNAIKDRFSSDSANFLLKKCHLREKQLILINAAAHSKA